MSDVAIYESASGQIAVTVEHDSVWLRQEQLAELFGRDRTVIGRHIRNVFAEGELERESNVQNLHIAGSDKPVAFYNLDVIISLGYRVKSREGTRFRQWANQVLKQHLTRGYTLNRERFEANARELEAALELVRKTARTPELGEAGGRGLVEIVSRYTQTFRRHVKLMILVRQHTDQSWGIYWAKNIGAPGKPAIPYIINKGKGDKYPLGTFIHVKEPMKTLCRNYEKRLAQIRAACFQNRTLRRSLVAHGQQVERTIRAVTRKGSSCQPHVRRRMASGCASQPALVGAWPDGPWCQQRRTASSASTPQSLCVLRRM